MTSWSSGLRALLRDALPFIKAIAILLCALALVCGIVAASQHAIHETLTFGGLALALSPAFLGITRVTSDLVSRSDRALAVLALAWVFGCVVASLPFFILGSYLDTPGMASSYGSAPLAFFEGVSGLTSTGLTVCAAPASLPLSVQFWRSCLQWVGGIGLAAFVAPFLRRHRKQVFTGEVDVPPTEGRPNVVLHWVLGLYLGLTILCFGSLLLFGTPAWEALNHSLSAAATGGFTVTNEGVTHYGIAPLLVIATTIVLSGSSLVVLVHWARSERSTDWTHHQNLQVPSYFGFALCGALISSYLVDGDTDERLRGAFNWLSATSTSGFDAMDVKRWSQSLFPLAVFTMFVGACHSSTGGGMKHSRLITLLAASPFPLPRCLRQPIKGVVREALLVTAGFVALIGVATPTISVLEECSWGDALFEVTSASSGVGLSVGIASSEMTSSTALLMSALMLLGRLEILALVFLAAGPFSLKLPEFMSIPEK